MLFTACHGGLRETRWSFLCHEQKLSKLRQSLQKKWKKVNFKFQPARMSHWLDGRRPKVSRNSKYQQVIFILNFNHAFMIREITIWNANHDLERMNLPKKIIFYKRGASHREEEFSCYSYRQSGREGPLEVTFWFSISVGLYFMYLCHVWCLRYVMFSLASSLALVGQNNHQRWR